ncbi:MAG: dihydroorotate dehydrogenase electron transfer subunit [Candidatus Thorarchaeota archaeon]
MIIDRLMGNQVSIRISEIVKETDTACTILFNTPISDLNILPGQFFMIWVPGVDEVPMSVSLWEPPSIGFTVFPVGEATESLVSLQPGNWLGIRGPFGSAFTLTSKRALVVGGGIGMAPLRPLVYNLLNNGAKVTLLIAARSKEELVFLDEFSKVSAKDFVLKTSTDDGSSGFKGFATDAVKDEIDVDEFDTVYTCGPELMMFGLYNQVKKLGIRFEASLERIMKCGCGICGTCAMDPTGTLVCMDGPIYSGNQLSEVKEFGKYHRDATGLKTKF